MLEGHKAKSGTFFGASFRALLGALGASGFHALGLNLLGHSFTLWSF